MGKPTTLLRWHIKVRCGLCLAPAAEQSLLSKLVANQRPRGDRIAARLLNKSAASSPHAGARVAQPRTDSGKGGKTVPLAEDLRNGTSADTAGVTDTNDRTAKVGRYRHRNGANAQADARRTYANPLRRACEAGNQHRPPYQPTNETKGTT